MALAAAWRRVPARLALASELGLALVVLAAIWKINFFIVLPLVSPEFVALLPHVVTFASKLLFAFAVAAVLRYGGALERSIHD